jgi:hypothetical protein
MNRVDMIHRTVKLVHKFRRIQIMCGDLYTQGHVAPTETPPIPRNKSGDVTLPARATENNGSVKGRIVRGDVKMVDAP